MRNLVFGLIILIIVLGGAYLLFGKNFQKSNNTTNPTVTTSPAPTTSEPAPTQKTPEETSSKETITYSKGGFTPSSTTVKSPAQVTFVNNSDETVQVASNPHPVHTDNPELNLGSIAPGEQGMATLTKTGTFGFHNHLESSEGGSITVE